LKEGRTERGEKGRTKERSSLLSHMGNCLKTHLFLLQKQTTLPPRSSPALDRHSCRPLGRARSFPPCRHAQEGEKSASRIRASEGLTLSPEGNNRAVGEVKNRRSFCSGDKLEPLSSTMLLVPSVSFLYLGARDLASSIDLRKEKEGKRHRTVFATRSESAWIPSSGSASSRSQDATSSV